MGIAFLLLDDLSKIHLTILNVLLCKGDGNVGLHSANLLRTLLIYVWSVMRTLFAPLPPLNIGHLNRREHLDEVVLRNLLFCCDNDRPIPSATLDRHVHVS